MEREILDQFEGKMNVTKIIYDNGVVSYLTQSRRFDDEISAKGASRLNTIENEKKHVFFLFDNNDNEVGRYYLGKHLQGKSPSEIIELKDNLVFFESFNPEMKQWVPCIGISANNPLKDIASKAMPINNTQTIKKDTEKDNPSTVATEEDLVNAFTDEYGVMYSADGKRLLRITDELSSYSIRNGTKAICNGAFNFAEDEDSYVFSYNDTLESIIIPDSVCRIGNNAFRNCVTLSEVMLSDAIKEIGDYAFCGCKSLAAIQLPETLCEMGEAAFYGCEALSSIQIPNSLSKLSNSVFSECAISQISIPDSIQVIEDYAFYQCSNLKKVKIPESVVKFGVGVFGGCPLIQFDIPKSLTEIGFEFFSWSAFDQITIPNWVTKIGARAFCNSRLTHISIPSFVTTIEENAFSDCNQLIQVTFSGMVSQIGDGVFEGCDALRKIIIPNGSKKHYEILLPEYRDIFVEQFCEQSVKEFDNIIGETISSQVCDLLGNTIKMNVKTTNHLFFLQQLLNDSFFAFKHYTETSNYPSYMLAEKQFYLADNSKIAYAVPFLCLRTYAKKNVSRFNEIMDLLNEEFNVTLKDVTPSNIVKYITQNGFWEYEPDFDILRNQSGLERFYIDSTCLVKFIYLFGDNIDGANLLPNQNCRVSIPTSTHAINEIINEMVDLFRQGNIEN